MADTSAPQFRRAVVALSGGRTDRSIVALASEEEVNARIVSVFGAFDPHIPAGSELAGAKNVQLDTGGHFRILNDPRVLDELDALAAPPPTP